MGLIIFPHSIVMINVKHFHYYYLLIIIIILYKIEMSTTTPQIYSVCKKCYIWEAWLVPLVEHVTVDLRVLNSSPILGIELTQNKTKQNKTENKKCCIHVLFQHLFNADQLQAPSWVLVKTTLFNKYWHL